jgi:5-formyltetrahydrofolate cyclo-ligase
MNLKEKTELRKAARITRNAFSEEYISEASKSACERICATKEFMLAKTVLLYYPIKNEISPLYLIEIAQDLGKTVAFPVCNRDDGTLTFKAVTDVSELTGTSLGLFEPSISFEEVRINKDTVCIVPALLFSKEGHRLGYGMGYYDRFLDNFEGTSIGLSYSSLLCDALPHAEHDIPLNMIITESEVLYIA